MTKIKYGRKRKLIDRGWRRWFLKWKCRKVSIKKGYEIGQALIAMAQHCAVHHRMGCLGLAANQLGIRKRVFVAKRRNTFRIYVNPEILEGYQKYEVVEHCLSWPDNPNGFKVTRYKTILINASNLENPMLLKGLDAQIFQHEMDHLNGVMV